MQARRRNRKKLGRLKDAEVKSYVYEKLTKEGLTPEEISNEIQVDLPGKKISFKTIYNYTKRSDTSLKAYLVEKGKKRRQRVADRRGRFKQGAPDKRSIHTREEAANNRTELGHWEGDTIVSCRGGSGGVLSLIDRRSREKYYRRVPDLKAEIIYAFMIGFIENNKGRVKTITLDNGSEFAYSVLKKLEKLYPEIKFYYCDSYKSFQKGSVERSNKEIRKYYPKGTDFHGVTQAEIIEIQNKVNNKKMKIHGYLSPVNFRDQDLQTAIAA
jgi:IS30 family transposase